MNKKLAGSALLRHPDLVAEILSAVVANAVDVPVTLKIRTGWSPDERNCAEIAKLAERCGIQALTIHGRTRVFVQREADTTAFGQLNDVSIPIIANGDITDR